MRSKNRKYGRRWTGLCFFVWFAVSFTLAQTESSSQAIYKTTSHDFGKIQEADGPVSYTFEFTNTSRTPFVIEFISVSCGCTTPEYSKEPVLPGKSGRIKVSYDPAGRPGVFSSPVIVTSNNRRDQVRLTVQGEVIPRPKTVEDQFPVELLDNSLRATSNNLIFGYLGHGHRKSQTLEIYNSGKAPIRLGYRFTDETKTPRNICKVEITPSVLQPGAKGQVTFTYDLSESTIYGALASAFVLTAGNLSSRPVSAYVTATDDFMKLSENEKQNAPAGVFSSQFYHFGTVQRNRSVEKEFTIRNEGKSPLIVRDIKANGPNITYVLPKKEIAPGESVTLKATLKTGAKSERISESISIVFNDPSRPMREIRLGAAVE